MLISLGAGPAGLNFHTFPCGSNCPWNGSVLAEMCSERWRFIGIISNSSEVLVKGGSAVEKILLRPPSYIHTTTDRESDRLSHADWRADSAKRNPSRLSRAPVDKQRVRIARFGLTTTKHARQSGRYIFYKTSTDRPTASVSIQLSAWPTDQHATRHWLSTANQPSDRLTSDVIRDVRRTRHVTTIVIARARVELEARHWRG